MKRTENLNLPIYDNPESDIFKINDVNNAHEAIDKQYKELKNIKETVESTNPSANLQGQINDISASLDNNTNKTSAFVNVMQYKKLVIKATDSNGVEYDDWSNAIQTALNENNRVEIPSGDFGISKPIKISSYKELRGNGRSTKIESKVEMECVLEVGTYEESASYIDVGHIFIHGGTLAQKGIKCVGLTNHSTLHDMWIERCKKCGMYITKIWYASIEKIQIRFCYNGIDWLSTSSNPETETSNVNCVNLSNLYIAFIDNIGINIEGDTGYSNMISNSTIEACGTHGIYAKRIISPLTCLNVYMETIKSNGYQVDGGGTLNIIGGYINVEGDNSYGIKVGATVNKLIVSGTSIANWKKPMEYMIYSEAKYNEIMFNPLSEISKRAVYYTGKFKGDLANVIGKNGTDFGYDMDSLRTGKIELVATSGNGTPINMKMIKGATVKGSVDTTRIYRYEEDITSDGGWGACKITLSGRVNDNSDTLKTVYDINNAFFTPHRLHLAPFNTSNRPSEKMEGMVIYDLNLKKPIVWNGTNWTDFIGNIV